jgi:HPt (histidine-containing phosphotransfer) domain-containing protein
LKTAHRIAHTLKSNAGYLGKTALQQAASSLEQSLQNEPPEYDARQVGQIGLELEKVLTEFGPMVAALKAEKPTAVQMERGQLESLLTQLRPLLEKSDFNAVDIAKQLENVAGMENLAERIDEYDFDGALQILNNYKMK